MKEMRREGNTVACLQETSGCSSWVVLSKLLRFCLESETASVSFICFIKFRLYLPVFAFLLVLGVCLSVLCFTELGVYLPEFAFHRVCTELHFIQSGLHGPRFVPQLLDYVCFAFQSLRMWLYMACHCPAECLCLYCG